jgi:hypothetical protein
VQRTSALGRGSNENASRFHNPKLAEPEGAARGKPNAFTSFQGCSDLLSRLNIRHGTTPLTAAESSRRTTQARSDARRCVVRLNTRECGKAGDSGEGGARGGVEYAPTVQRAVAS